MNYQNNQNGYQQPQQYQQQPQQQYQAGAMPMDDEDLDLNSTIEDDGNEFVILPKGEYQYFVTDFEPAEYQDTKANKVRKKVIVHIEVEYEGKKHTIKEQIPLKKTMEWKFCQLFTSIGDRKSGEPLKMDWNSIRGKGGICEISPRKYRKQNGEDAETNSVSKFLPPAITPNTNVQQPTYQNPHQAPPQTGQAAQAGWQGGGNSNFA